MKKLFFLFVIIYVKPIANAQQLFINKASITFEVTQNNHKNIDSWNDGENESTWQENAKSNTNKFTISFYDYIFANNKSIYTFNKFDEKNKGQWDNDAMMEGNTWYHDFNTNTCAFKRYFWRDEYRFVDSIKDIKWKVIPNENRVIAGFNCRKAYTVLFDSVYIFAFYTDEITISGGPLGLHGLPGMILGVTVPRMFTSWMATKISLTNVDENLIVSPANKKSKTRAEILKKFNEKAEEEGKWLQRNIWSLFL